MAKPKTFRSPHQFPWRNGQLVCKIIHGIEGYREVVDARIDHIDAKEGVIYLSDREGGYETGITYDLDGNERERFFPGFRSEITPVEE